jgi:hypothetical protein
MHTTILRNSIWLQNIIIEWHKQILTLCAVKLTAVQQNKLWTFQYVNTGSNTITFSVAIPGCNCSTTTAVVHHATLSLERTSMQACSNTMSALSRHPNFVGTPGARSEYVRLWIHLNESRIDASYVVNTYWAFRSPVLKAAGYWSYSSIQTPKQISFYLDNEISTTQGLAGRKCDIYLWIRPSLCRLQHNICMDQISQGDISLAIFHSHVLVYKKYCKNKETNTIKLI